MASALPLEGEEDKSVKTDQSLLKVARHVRYKLRDGKPKKQLNILILGMTGVGKSTFVNSLWMAINPRGYKTVVRRGGYGEGGKGGRAVVTLNINKLKLLQSVPEGGEERNYICQPCIWDCPGLPDEDEETIKRIITMIIEGQIKDDANMSSLLKLKPEELKRHSKTFGGKDLVEAIIVVHAATDPMAENLFQAIREAAMPNEAGKRQIPVFGLISKIDILKKQKKEDLLEQIRNSFAEELGLAGVQDNIFVSPLYCEDISPGLARKHHIDKVMCDIWDKLLSSEVPKPKQSGLLKFFR